jgi:tetratricopeptide (TPR) repeat protein
MASEVAKSLVKPAIKCASTACGLALGGFLGGAAGGVVGAAFGRLAGEALGEFGKKITEAAVEKGSEYFVDKSAEPLIDGFRKSHPTLEEVYREAFRLSLFSIRPDPKNTALNLSSAYGRASAEYLDWFENWDAALKLKKDVALNVKGLDLPENDLQADTCFKAAMERVDAQGGMLRGRAIRDGKRVSVENPSDLPDGLLAFLKARLPDLFVQFYKDELVKEENRTAFNEKELIFQQQFVASFARLEKAVHEVKDDTTAIREEQAAQGDKLDAILKMLGGRFDAGVVVGTIPESALKEKDDIIARMAEELETLRKQLSARAADPAQAEPKDADLSKALSTGDLDGALRLKIQQVEYRREEAAKLPRDYYELGTIHELRFEWPQALAAFLQAWELGKDTEYGFKYARFAQKLNHFNEAIGAYEALLLIYTEPSDRAGTLNNLANLYSGTQRMQKAEEAYGEALAIRRKLAEANPDAYLPEVTMTLNNLAVLYSDTQRMQKAEEAYGEALVIRRKLAEANPEAYLPNVAATLSNLAYLLLSMERLQEAETIAREAELLLTPLWHANPTLLGNQIARILSTQALIFEASQSTASEACAYARRAFAAAIDTALKESIRQIIDRLSPESENEPHY